MKRGGGEGFVKQGKKKRGKRREKKGRGRGRRRGRRGKLRGESRIVQEVGKGMGGVMCFITLISYILNNNIFIKSRQNPKYKDLINLATSQHYNIYDSILPIQYKRFFLMGD